MLIVDGREAFYLKARSQAKSAMGCAHIDQADGKHTASSYRVQGAREYRACLAVCVNVI